MFLGEINLFGLGPVLSWVLIGVSFTSVVASVGILIRFRRRNDELGPVPLFSTIPELNKAIEFTGFAYDPQQNIFYSTHNCWQRKFGYCRLYDEGAIAFHMVIDCEPFYFDYGGKHWLIELWKGQYGMTTGGEIGIYYREDDGKDLGNWTGWHYKSVPDSEYIDMYQILYKNGKPLYTRHERHWWLTGFVLGEFSYPHELTMIARLTLNSYGMRDAFLQALRNKGYQPHEYRVKGLSVAIQFTKPYSPQPYSRNRVTTFFVQRANRMKCNLYRKITGPYNNIIEKMNALRKENDELFRYALTLGKQRDLFEKGDRSHVKTS